MEFFRETIYPRGCFWICEKDTETFLMDGNDVVCEITYILDFQCAKRVLRHHMSEVKGILKIYNRLYLMYEYDQFPGDIFLAQLPDYYSTDDSTEEI